MPHLRIDTNVPRSQVPSGLAKELASVIATSLDKPLNVCVVTINTDQVMTFGGEDNGPCCQATLMSIGRLGVEENKKHSKAIADTIQSGLGIIPTKMYILFQDAKPADIGVNGTTVHYVI